MMPQRRSTMLSRILCLSQRLASSGYTTRVTMSRSPCMSRNVDDTKILASFHSPLFTSPLLVLVLVLPLLLLLMLLMLLLLFVDDDEESDDDDDDDDDNDNGEGMVKGSGGGMMSSVVMENSRLMCSTSSTWLALPSSAM